MRFEWKENEEKKWFFFLFLSYDVILKRCVKHGFAEEFDAISCVSDTGTGHG